MNRRLRAGAVILLSLAATAANALTATVNNGISFGTVAAPPGLFASTITISTSGFLSTNNPGQINFISGSGAQAASISLTEGLPGDVVSYFFSYNSMGSGSLTMGSATSNPNGSCTLDGSGNCNISLGATVTFNGPAAGNYSAANAIVMTLNYT